MIHFRTFFILQIIVVLFCWQNQYSPVPETKTTPFSPLSAYDDPPLPFPNNTCTPMCKLTLASLNKHFTQVLTETQLVLKANVSNEYFRTHFKNVVSGYIANDVTHSEVLGVEQVEVVGTSKYDMTCPWSLIRNVSTHVIDNIFGHIQSDFRIYAISFLAVQIFVFLILSCASTCLLCCFFNRFSDYILRSFCLIVTKSKKRGDDGNRRSEYERVI